MEQLAKYYLIETSALPEIFLKVIQTKRLLETGEVRTVSEAIAVTDISRSSFYKYKDSIFPFQDMISGRIVTFSTLLKDVTGTLSAVLNSFAEVGANILTINQGVPSNGCAIVTISAQTGNLMMSMEDFLKLIESVPGVIKFNILAG